MDADRRQRTPSLTGIVSKRLGFRVPTRRNDVAAACHNISHRDRIAACVGDVGIAFLLHQLIFIGVAALALNLLPAYSGGAYPTWHATTQPLIDASWRWDGQWYASIAVEGYRRAGDGYQNVAFFPLYPLLIRVLALPWGDSAVPLVGALIPRLAFLAGLAYLYRLASIEYDRGVAARTVLYTAVYPAALFFSAAYAESLFLLTSVAGFYYARQGRWWQAGSWALLATLTRLQGVLLIIPLVYELWRQGVLHDRGRFPLALTVLLIPAGLAAFVLYLHWSVGDGLAFFHAQSAWLRTFAAPHETLYRAIGMVIAGEADGTRRIMGMLNTGATLLFAAATVGCMRWQRLSYAVYSLLALAMPLTAPVPDMPTVSMARFTAVLFPAFFLLAVWGRNRYVHHLILAVSLALFTLLTALFVNWYWVV